MLFSSIALFGTLVMRGRATTNAAYWQSLQDSDIYLGMARTVFGQWPAHPGGAALFPFLFKMLGLDENLDPFSFFAFSCPPRRKPLNHVQVRALATAILDKIKRKSAQAEEAEEPRQKTQGAQVDDASPKADGRRLLLMEDPAALPRAREDLSEKLKTIWNDAMQKAGEAAMEGGAYENLVMQMPVGRARVGLNALGYFLNKTYEDPELRLVMQRTLAHYKLAPEPEPSQLELRSTLSWLKLCITEVPDALIGLSASKTFGRLISRSFDRLKFSSSLFPPSVTVDLEFPMHDLASSLCEAADFSVDGKDFAPVWAVCAMANAVGAFAATMVAPLNCTEIPLEPVPIPHRCGAQPASMDMRLRPEAEVLLDDGSVNQTVIDLEKHVYMYDFFATLLQVQFAVQSLCGIPRSVDALVPGWKRVAEIFLSQENALLLHEGQTSHLSFATISRQQDGDKMKCAWHITQRGTLTDHEWVSDFRAEMTAAPFVFANDPNSMPSGSQWHRGFAELTSTVLPYLRLFFDKYIGPGRECGYSESYIHIAGHSLGGAVGYFYAAFLAYAYGTRGVAIDLVAFAPARALNRVLANYTRRYVNVRSIVNDLDPVPRLACNNRHGLARGDSRKFFAFQGDGRDQPYADHINEIPVNVEVLQHMNAQKFANNHFQLFWGVTSLFKPNVVMPSHLDLAATHADSYACWAVTHGCAEEYTHPSCSGSSIWRANGLTM